MSEPFYVLELDSAQNALVVGTAAELGRDQLLAENVNWTLGEPVASGTRVQCKIRYRARAVDCTLYPLEHDAVEVRFDEAAARHHAGAGRCVL